MWNPDGELGYAKIDLADYKSIIITSRRGAEAISSKRDNLVQPLDVTDYLPNDMHDWTNGSKAALDAVTHAINTAFATSGVVAIHCDRGRSRSPVAAGAYMLRYLHIPRAGVINAIRNGYASSNMLHGGLNEERLNNQLLNYALALGIEQTVSGRVATRFQVRI